MTAKLVFNDVLYTKAMVHVVANKIKKVRVYILSCGRIPVAAIFICEKKKCATLLGDCFYYINS